MPGRRLGCITHLGQSASSPRCRAAATASSREWTPKRPQDPADVVADGLALDAEPVGDLRGGLAVREMVQHLELPRRQPDREAAAA